MGVDQIFNLGTAGELKRFFDFVDAANIGVDEHGAAVPALDDGEVGSAFGANDGECGFADLADGRFHWLRG